MEKTTHGRMIDVLRSAGFSMDEIRSFVAERKTLRDEFAAKALPSVYEEYVMDAREEGFVEDWKMGVALDAYAMADAMLRARDAK